MSGARLHPPVGRTALLARLDQFVLLIMADDRHSVADQIASSYLCAFSPPRSAARFGN